MAIISSKKQPPDSDGQEQGDLLPLETAVSGGRAIGGKSSKQMVSLSSSEALLKPEAEPEEHGKQEEQLRPQRLTEYIGQKDLKEVLEIAIKAAKARSETLDHLLLYGPPGLGKTTMSLILAAEMGVGCKITSAPALERTRDIVGLLVNLQPGTFYLLMKFIDCLR